jgi:RecB family exonuclease
VLSTGGVVPVHPDRRLGLSASQLKTYDDCPLRYAYEYALDVKGRAGVSAEIGSLVHAALAEFLDPGGPEDRSWERLERLAEAHWSPNIAPYRPVREQARRDIFTMLRDWWERGVPDSVLAVEHHFDVPVGDHRVRGFIDRVDRVGDTESGIAIIDYKTGSRVPTAAEVAEDLQLATYHLAAERDAELQACGPPLSLGLLHLRSGRITEQTISDGHAAATEARIVKAATRILTETFEPSVEADCEYCDFRRICPLQPEGREVGIQ